METLEFTDGLYLVFHYQGNRNNAAEFYKNFFINWIPNSEYEVDNCPLFQILGKKYKNNNVTSKEDIYISIKKQNP